MEKFKIEHFEAEKKIAFPWFRSLSTEECANIFEHWKTVNRSKINSSNLDLVRDICSKSKLIESYSTEDEDFDLTTILENLNITVKSRVYLNWYRFDQIDEMLFKDLALFFNDIWYPSTDDLDIFDSSFKWLISVSHYGQISYLKI